MSSMNWLDGMISAIQGYVTLAAIAFLLILAFFWIYRYGISVFQPLNRDLSLLNKYLPSLHQDAEENFNNMDQFIRGKRLSAPLKNAWFRFAEDTGVSQKDLNIEEYFNTIRLIQIPAARKKAEAKASMLMTFGFAAGFLRLIAGLRAEDFSLDQTPLIINMVTELILITIAALLLSFLYQTIDKHFYQTAVNEIYKLQANLKRKVYIQKEAAHMKEVAASMDNLAQNIYTYAKDSLENQQGALEKLVSLFLDKLNGSLQGQFISLAQTMEDLVVAQTASKDQVTALIQELIKGNSNQQKINQSTASIVTAITEHSRQINESSRSLEISLINVKGLTDALNETVTFNREVLKEIRKEKEHIQQGYNVYFDNIRKQVEDFQHQTGAELARVLERFSEVSGQIMDRLEGTVVDSMGQWSEANQALLTHMERQTQALAEASQAVSERMGSLSRSMEDSMEAFAQALHQGTTQTLCDFDQGLGEISERLGATLEEIREAVDTLPAVIDGLKKNLMV